MCARRVSCVCVHRLRYADKHWINFCVFDAIPSRIQRTTRHDIKFKTFLQSTVLCYCWSLLWFAFETSCFPFAVTSTRLNANNVFCVCREWEKTKGVRTSLERGLPRRDNRLLQSFFWLSDEYDLHIGCDADIIYFVSSIFVFVFSWAFRLFVCSHVPTSCGWSVFSCGIDEESRCDATANRKKTKNNK